MLKFLKKNYLILISLLVLLINYNGLKKEFKKAFKKTEFETENNNGIKLSIFTNWFEFEGGKHSIVQVHKSGSFSKIYYFGENRNERIDSIVNIEWLNNDSLIVIHTKLKNMERKIDSLFWVKNN